MTLIELAFYGASFPAAFLAGVVTGWKHPNLFVTWRKR